MAENRFTKENLEPFHDSLCPERVGDGECCCAVKAILDLQGKLDRLLEEKKKALHAAVAAIYFDDSADYKTALWSVIGALDPEAAELLEKDEHAAFVRYCD
jgi:hypothetical protein